MQSTALPIRTHRNFADGETFQDLLAERLRQSPWMLLSGAVHVALLLMVWAMFPPDRPEPAKVRVALALPDLQDVIKPPPPPPPEIQPEVVEDDPVVVDEAFEPSDEDANDNSDVDATSSTESSFEFTGDNTAVGLSGNAGGPYGQRGTRGGGKRGGRSSAASVARGLQWLAAHQDQDGRWDVDGFAKHDDPAFSLCSGPGNQVHDVGVTGLALLAFLGDNNTMRSGIYRDVVRKGVRWLKSVQQPNGLFGDAAAHDFVYDHAIAAYAMCEAYGLSQYKLLRRSAQQGLNYLESHRNSYGAWRYQPQDQDNDISVTGWCIMAYEAGKFFGLQVNEQALQNAEVFLDKISDESGLHGYRRAGERSGRRDYGGHATRFPAHKTHALTAVGLFSRFFLGQDPSEHGIMNASAKLLAEIPPKWDEADGSIDHYYWYYATYALFQYGGKPWMQWQKALERAVIPNQHQAASQPNLLGSWDPIGAWGEDGGRVYTTAILTLTLQANYRYSRLIR
ncbi:MAG: prenyltransferase/squalene oxidase repeat-containing protein [Planctomycetota bacterium]